MLKRIAAASIAVVIPSLLFMVVIGLNESDIERDFLEKRVTNFDVEKKKQIEQVKKQEKKKEPKRKPADQLPTMKPTNLGDSLASSGLSFGVPQFDEAEFSEFKDDDLFDTANKGPMDKSSVDTPPKPIKRSPIVYPEFARKQGISGYVAMNVLINEDGNVEDVNIVDSKPEEIFDLQADSTIRRWKFEPATYNGKKVKVWAMQKIVFKLN